VTCWRNVGENALESLAKGDPVVVHGKLRDSSYEKEGSRHAVFEIEAYSLGHDISRGVSRFTRASFVPGGREVVLDDDETTDSGDGAAAGRGDGDGIVADLSPSAA
jgi:single-strand DNA-binding protein